jgi:hypothetical protein
MAAMSGIPGKEQKNPTERHVDERRHLLKLNH